VWLVSEGAAGCRFEGWRRTMPMSNTRRRAVRWTQVADCAPAAARRQQSSAATSVEEGSAQKYKTGVLVLPLLHPVPMTCT
jgi:hypothetical protein